MPQNERCASAVGIAHFDLQGMSVHNDREYVLLFFPSLTSRSINNLPLFLFDVNVYVLHTTEASIYSSQPTTEKSARAPGCRASLKRPATIIVVNVLKTYTTRKTAWSKHASRGSRSQSCAIRLIRRPDQPCINPLRRTQ